jgi:ribosomal protein S27AE
MPGISKKFITDEIEIVFSFDEKHSLNNIKINVSDEGQEMYPPVIDSFNKSLIRDALSRGIMQTLLSQGASQKKAHEKKKDILTKKKCPNCGELMVLVEPCCQEKKNLEKKGVVAILSCSKCGQKSWVKKEELKLIPLEEEEANA